MQFLLPSVSERPSFHSDTGQHLRSLPASPRVLHTSVVIVRFFATVCILESPDFLRDVSKSANIKVHSFYCKILWTFDKCMVSFISFIHHYNITHNSFTILKKKIFCTSSLQSSHSLKPFVTMDLLPNLYNSPFPEYHLSVIF